MLDYKLSGCAGSQPEICYSSDQPAGSADSDQESTNSCGPQLTLLKYWKGFPSSSRESLGALQTADTRYCIPTRWQGWLITLKQMKTPGFPKRLGHMCILQAQQLFSGRGASSYSCQTSKHGEVGPGLCTVDNNTYNVRALKRLCAPVWGHLSTRSLFVKLRRVLRCSRRGITHLSPMESGGGVLFTLCEENPLGSFGSIVPGNVLRRLCRKLGPEPRAGCGIINYSTDTAKKGGDLDRGPGTGDDGNLSPFICDGSGKPGRIANSCMWSLGN